MAIVFTALYGIINLTNVFGSNPGIVQTFYYAKNMVNVNCKVISLQHRLLHCLAPVEDKFDYFVQQAECH
jgi:hypothetical protein